MQYTEIESPPLFTPTRQSFDSILDLLTLSNENCELVLMGSGKAALFTALEYYKKQGRYRTKNDVMLTPKWVGSWVHNTAQKTCFPSLVSGSDPFAMLAYHQYGFSQDIEEIQSYAKEKDMLLIEDCAHAIQTYNGTSRLGTIGHCGIFSFSKFFPSVTGGALITRDKGLAEYARSRGNINWISWFSHLVKSFHDRSHNYPSIQRKLFYLVEMSYPVYDKVGQINPSALRIVVESLLKDSLEIRRLNAEYVYNALSESGVFCDLDIEGVIPYVLPVFHQKNKLEKVVLEFSRLGIRSGVYQFDIHKNLLDPKFIPCVWVPVHPGINKSLLDQMIKVIRRELCR